LRKKLVVLNESAKLGDSGICHVRGFVLNVLALVTYLPLSQAKLASGLTFLRCGCDTATQTDDPTVRSAEGCADAREEREPRIGIALAEVANVILRPTQKVKLFARRLCFTRPAEKRILQRFVRRAFLVRIHSSVSVWFFLLTVCDIRIVKAHRRVGVILHDAVPILPAVPLAANEAARGPCHGLHLLAGPVDHVPHAHVGEEGIRLDNAGIYVIGHGVTGIGAQEGCRASRAHKMGKVHVASIRPQTLLAQVVAFFRDEVPAEALIELACLGGVAECGNFIIAHARSALRERLAELIDERAAEHLECSLSGR
jgi:hypothetical protein